jgi:sporulation integral membrane protein YtvI
MSADNQRYLTAVSLWTLLVVSTIAFWRYLVPYTVPFVIAVFLAALLDPVVAVVERACLPRWLATVAGMVLVLGGALTGAALLVSVVVRELVGLTAGLPALVRTAQPVVDGWMGRLMAWGHFHVPTPEALVNGQMANAYRLTAAVVHALLSVVLGLPNLVLVAVLAVMAAFFLVRDKRGVAEVLEWTLPPVMRDRLPTLRTEVVRGTLGFLRAQAFLVLSTAATTTAGLMLLGSPYAVLLGMVAGLLDLIPFLGPTALLAPWAAAMFILGRTVLGLELLVVLAAVALVRQLIEPRLVGSGTGLHPLTALVALYVGIQLFGPIGFVIGPISAVVLKAAARAAGLPPFRQA